MVYCIDEIPENFGGRVKFLVEDNAHKSHQYTSSTDRPYDEESQPGDVADAVMCLFRSVDLSTFGWTFQYSDVSFQRARCSAGALLDR